MATATVIMCEAVAPAAVAAIVPLQACGCPRLYPLAYGHHCIVHDDKGKRWDAYTFEDVLREWHMRDKDVVIAKRGDDLDCYACHNCRSHTLKPGERGVWTGGGGEQPEWEFECEHAFRQNFIDSVTTDWIGFAVEDDKKWRAERAAKALTGGT